MSLYLCLKYDYVKSFKCIARLCFYSVFFLLYSLDFIMLWNIVLMIRARIPWQCIFPLLKFNICVRYNMAIIVPMHLDKPSITYLHEGVNTHFLMNLLDGHGFGYSMRYHKVYVFLNLACGILALTYRVCSSSQQICYGRAHTDCEIVWLQTQCPFLKMCYYFWTWVFQNGLEQLVVSNNDKFSAVNI